MRFVCFKLSFYLDFCNGIFTSYLPSFRLFIFMRLFKLQFNRSVMWTSLLFFRSTSFSMFIPIFSLKCFVFAHCQHLTRCSHSIRRVNPSEGTMKNEEFVNNAWYHKLMHINRVYAMELHSREALRILEFRNFQIWTHKCTWFSMYNAFIFICRERKEFMSSGFSPTQPHLLFFSLPS